MDNTITSSFDPRYYSRATCGALLFASFSAYLLFHCLMGDFLNKTNAYLTTAIILGFTWVFFYFFSKSWKKVTVTASEITITNTIFKKQVIIPYADITSVGTYGRTGGRAGQWQDFVIGYAGNKSIGFNEAWYDNYSKLTMAIYIHKYGPGHGRERYLERHGLVEN